MTDTIKITPTADGPNMVTGAIELLWPSTHVISQAGEADENGAIYLCRCGASANKPFWENLTSASASSRARETRRRTASSE